MGSAQTELLPLPPLSGLVEKFRTAFTAPDMGRARENIVAHAECDAAFIAGLLTGVKPPRLPAEYDDSFDPFPEPLQNRGLGATDGTWSWNVEQLFDAMFDDPNLTFEQALAVWEHPNYRRHLKSSWRPNTGRMGELFSKQSLAEQFDTIERYVQKRGVEQEHNTGTTMLDHMLYWLSIKKDTRAEHFRRWLTLALCRDFHDPQSDKESFLTILRAMRQAALAS